MERKEMSQLAIDLIEEALEKPNQTIVLEERIKKPICEPGIKEPTEQELVFTRADIMSSIFDISKTHIYQNYVQTSSFNPYLPEIVYENGSKITMMVKNKP